MRMKQMTKINDQIQKAMIEAAAKVRENAYAPYSTFKVGAALLFEDGSLEVGCNVENASYGLAICAERVAMTTAVAKGKTGVAGVAVVTDMKDPGAPCGACRQFLSEFNGEMAIILANDKGNVTKTTLADLLPMQFSQDSLAKEQRS